MKIKTQENADKICKIRPPLKKKLFPSWDGAKAGCPRILENLFKTYFGPNFGNLRPISNGLQRPDIIDRIYSGKVQFSVSTGSQFYRDYTSISFCLDSI